MPKQATLKITADTAALDDALGQMSQRLADFAAQVTALSDDMAAHSATTRASDVANDAATQVALLASVQAVQAKIIALKRDTSAITTDMAQHDADQQKRLNNEIAQTVARSSLQLIEGRRSFVQIAEGLGEQLLQKGIANVTREVLARIEGETQKTTATVTGAAARTTAETEGAAATKAVTASTAQSGILAKAADAAAGAYEALASIPVVGPALGAAAAAATFTAVAAYGSLFSAAGGFDVPAGLNPVTQLHQREMVLPAAYADVIRGLAAGSGGGAGGGGGGGDTHHHWSPTINVNGSNDPAIDGHGILSHLDRAVRNASWTRYPNLKRVMAT